MRRPHAIWIAAILVSLVVVVSPAVFPLASQRARVTSSDLNVTGLYYSLTDFTERDRWLGPENLCHEHGQFLREPFSRDYEPRDSLEEIEGDVPLAYWMWQGNITAKQFRFGYKHPLVMKYKIMDGKIYYHEKLGIPELQHVRRVAMEELLRVTLHLFPIPDMEFLMHFGDNSFSQRPALTMAIFRHYHYGGFTMPSYSVWKRSLGPLQMGAYHACLRHRYPATNGSRIPQVVWRGSNTGKAKHFNKETCMNLPRVNLHMLGKEHQDLMDVQLNLLVPPCGKIVPTLLDGVNTTRVRAEDYNRYCIILDIDGNSWSDRFATNLVHYNTPILKQATNATGFADHFFTAGVEVVYFRADLSDLVRQARSLVADCIRHAEVSRGQAMARRMQIVAQNLFTHVGIARAMAYALVNYKRLSAWEMDRSLDGYRLVDTPCCMHPTLPPELKAAINKRQNLTTSPPPPPPPPLHFPPAPGTLRR